LAQSGQFALLDSVHCSNLRFYWLPRQKQRLSPLGVFDLPCRFSATATSLAAG